MHLKNISLGLRGTHARSPADPML